MHFQSKLRSSGVDHSANAERPASQLFPDNAAAECWFAWQRWQGEETCPHCRSLSIQEGGATQVHALPLPQLRQEVQRTHGDGHGEFQSRLPDLGIGDACVRHSRQRPVEHETAPGFGHLLQVRLTPLQRLRQIRQDWQNPLFDCINGLIRFASASQEGNGHLLPRVGLGRRMADETRAIPSIGWKILIEDAATLPAESKHPSWMICHEETASDHSSDRPPNGRLPPPPPPPTTDHKAGRPLRLNGQKHPVRFAATKERQNAVPEPRQPLAAAQTVAQRRQAAEPLSRD